MWDKLSKEEAAAWRRPAVQLWDANHAYHCHFVSLFGEPICEPMVLEYLPTFTPKMSHNVGKYSSTTEHLGNDFRPSYIRVHPLQNPTGTSCFLVVSCDGDLWIWNAVWYLHSHHSIKNTDQIISHRLSGYPTCCVERQERSHTTYLVKTASHACGEHLTYIRWSNSVCYWGLLGSIPSLSSLAYNMAVNHRWSHLPNHTGNKSP